MSITYTNGEGLRFANALGKILGLRDVDGTPRAATANECKQYLMNTMRTVVFQVERETAMQAIQDTPFTPT